MNPKLEEIYEKAQNCIDEMPEHLKDWNAFVIEEREVE